MIDWTKQHCGVRQAPFEVVQLLMPDLAPILETFPDAPNMFTWDVKVHMLMPGQYPCIPGWHTDNVPRVNGIQRFDLIQTHLPMYLWVSNAPLTQFKHGFLTPGAWHRFTQQDEHRGTVANDFGWRGMIRATHHEIQSALKVKDRSEYLRRHSQVYLNADGYQW